MAVPGSYHPPDVPGTTPAPTPTPTPTPTPGAGGGPGSWWGRLFGDTANLPDWLKNLLGGAGGGTLPTPIPPGGDGGYGWRPRGGGWGTGRSGWNFPAGAGTGEYTPHGWAAKFIPDGAFQRPPDATTPGGPTGGIPAGFGDIDWEKLRLARAGLVNGGTAATVGGGGSALFGGGGGGGTASGSSGGGGLGGTGSGGSSWASFFGR